MTLTEEPAHDIRFQLNAARIDAATGIIREATVAQSGVEALGKFVLVDAQGKLTRDPAQAKKKLQVVTDETTLTTLLTQAKAAGGRLKIRSDHDDSLGARAGYADNFRRLENRVVADLHLSDSYRDRAIVLETAQDTPELIGLSIDFAPTFELKDGAALMRVGELFAVDIVDAGAITHGGLFLRRVVDTRERAELETIVREILSTTMAEKSTKDPVDIMAEVLSAVTGLSAGHKQLMDGYASLNTKVDGCMSAIAAMSGEKKNSATAADAEALAAVKTELSAVKESISTMQKERAALGLKGGSKEAGAGAGSAEPGAEERAKKEAPKTYLVLVAERKAEGKMSPSDCHRAVQKEFPDSYRLHLDAKGVARSAA